VSGTAVHGTAAAGVHQFVPMLHRRDAVGEHVLAVQSLLVASGVSSRIYVDRPDPETAPLTRPYRAYEDDAVPGDVLVYQLATGSEIAGWLAGRSEPLVVDYHSVTPPDHFMAWNNPVARLQVVCLAELRSLASRATLGIADSVMTVRELEAAGYRRTTVAPVLVASRHLGEPDPAMLEDLRSDGDVRTWLSVGRLAPHKAHHQVIAALFAQVMGGGEPTRLVLVGAPTEPHYAAALRRYAALLGLAGSVRLLSGLTDGELAACYEVADVLVMASDHEGFGVPLVEAMRQRVPVVAFDAGAVAESLAGAGVLVDDKRPCSLAATIDGVIADRDRSARLVEAGTARVAALDAQRADQIMLEALSTVTAATPGAAVLPGGGPPIRAGSVDRDDC
jgi:glycosyltransferase involved in cell wall biosynthesis